MSPSNPRPQAPSPKPSNDIPGVGVGEILGTGAFGVVHRGKHRTLDVDVAVKIIKPDVGDMATLDRALGEARLMARLDHPNLLRIHDAGRLGASLYLVMEYMDGGTLEGQRRVAGQRLMETTRQLLSGLQALHDARILHRDIKPANCLVRNRDGRVKLADMGIAVEQATRPDHGAELVGTLPFMAPELFDESPSFSHQSDLYALGLTLTCMALDEDPFPTGSAGQILYWIASGKRPDLMSERSDLPHVLTAVLGRMMSPDPRDRPESAAVALSMLSDTMVLDLTKLSGAIAALSDEPVVGPWVVGAAVHESTNWEGHAATHIHTGAPARLTFLKADGPLARASSLILDSAERASGLEHPSILDVLDWGTHEGRPYVVTSPRGRSMGDLIEASGALREVEALRVAASLADALAYLHDRGLVYQIVEPGSALIGADALSAMLGWPIFCVPTGTPAIDGSGAAQKVRVSPFFAPEAVSHKDPIAPAVDIYGVGEVLFFLLAGSPAFDKPAFGQVMLSKGRGAPDIKALVPTVTGPTASLLARLLDPDPRRRPQRAEAVRDQLERLARRLRPRGA